MQLLDLKDIWCPVCRTHYTFAWDPNTNSSYLDHYSFYSKNTSFYATFFPKYPTIREQDLFQIRWFNFNGWDVGGSGPQWETITELNYLPNHITPFNFSEKLKILLVFL